MIVRIYRLKWSIVRENSHSSTKVDFPVQENGFQQSPQTAALKFLPSGNTPLFLDCQVLCSLLYGEAPLPGCVFSGKLLQDYAMLSSEFLDGGCEPELVFRPHIAGDVSPANRSNIHCPGASCFKRPAAQDT